MFKIGQRLKEERKRLGLNQTEMGSHGKVSLQAQVRYEKGERTPDAAYLSGVANAGADILYIVTGQRTPVKIAALSIEETSLIDNYRHAAAEGRKALEATGAAITKSKKDGKVNKIA